MNRGGQFRIRRFLPMAMVQLAAAMAVFFIAAAASAQTTYNPTSGNATTGQTLFAACSGCHGASAGSNIPIRNAANAGWVINLAMANGMGGYSAASYNSTQEADLAAYISNLFSSTATSPNGQFVAHNSAGTALSLPNIYLGSAYGGFSSIQTVSGPSRGSVSYSGTTATYTPSTGQCGTDSFSWRATGLTDTPPTGGGLDTYYSNTRTSSVSIANPAAPNISTSTGAMSGSVGSVIGTFTPTNTGGTPLSYTLSGTLPTGLSFSTSTGQISGTPTQAGTFNVTVNAFNCFGGNLAGQSGSRAVSITIAKGSQSITFNALSAKLVSDPPFTVSATASSGLAVAFGASGVCSSSGTTGTTITLSGAVGSCTVTASQTGDTNWNAATAVMQSFMVSDPSGEVFPPNCQQLSGWTVPAGAVNGWNVASDASSTGLCSLKSGALPDSGSAVQTSAFQFSGNFQAGNISMSRRVSTESNFDCFRVLIDGVQQGVGGSCANLGNYFSPAIAAIGASGEIPFGTITIPISAGNHTVVLSYDKDSFCCRGVSDAVWVDQLTMPLLTSITSSLNPSGTVGVFFSYQIVAGNSPQTYISTMLPAGLTLNAATGLISGTPTTAGSFPVTVTASNPGGVAPSATDSKIVTFTINPAPQNISFAPINNRLTTGGAFVVSATGGASGNAVTFSANGVCASSGTNGTTITPSGAVGTCSVTANQAGNSNYLDASPVTQSFQVSLIGDETFPPNCGSLGAGWSTPAGATTGWSIVANSNSSEGACSLRSNAPGDNGKSQIQYSGTFVAGNISFSRKVSSESRYVVQLCGMFFCFIPQEDCLRFTIDGVQQNMGSCSLSGGLGVSGEQNFGTYSVPITAGVHTLVWSYEKDGAGATGQDAAWIDNVVFPQFTLNVTKTGGTGSGTVYSSPAGIACGGACSAVLSGDVSLSAVPNNGSYLAAWSGGGCSGNGTCIVTLAGTTTVNAQFNTIVPPSPPTTVNATPGDSQATLTFSGAVSAGAPITLYTSTCTASGQPTRTDSAANSPITATGLVNGVQYSCTIKATNSAGQGSASSAALVTPRTVPDAPTALMGTPGNGTISIAFTAPANNGGDPVNLYQASCIDGMANGLGTSTMSPVNLVGLVNGNTYSCTVRARNSAGYGPFSSAILVTPRTVPGLVQSVTPRPRDGRAVMEFVAPASDGGSPITSYTVSCNGGAQVATGSGSPITVTGLTNGTPATCSVRATNAAGDGPNFSVSVTAGVQTGTNYWSQICTSCHAMTPALPQLNAAGTTPAVLNYAIANQPLMSMRQDVLELTAAERTAIAAYLATVRPDAAATTAFNTPVVVELAAQLTLGTVSFESMEVVSSPAPASGTLSMLSGTQITFTPTAGFVGMATFTVRGARAMPTTLQGDPITVTVTVSPPPVPVITSMLSASGTNGVAFSYQITASNNPTGYNATGLPMGLTVNMMNGLISGTPAVGGSFMITLTASNQGGAGMSVQLSLTLNPAGQSITFGTQTTPTRPYAFGGTFTLAPAASASSSLAVTYVSKTPSVCSMGMETTVNILAAGTCTIGANQGGNANFSPAVEATQSVTITPIAPAAPTIGMATPGNNQAVVAFTAPTNTGGVPISGYTATCTASGQPTRTGTGGMSPILVTGLTNLVQYSCTVFATNSVGPGPASGAATVTPDQVPTAASIVSANSATFTVNAPGSFSIVATGYPTNFTYGVMGTLPTGVTLNTMSGVLSGTPTTAAGSPYVVTLSATNTGGTGTQMFTLTVNKGSQTISFSGPANQAFSAASIPLTAVATSGLTVTFVSDTTMVCSVSGANVTLLTTGTCTLRAQQAGNANFNAAPDVTQSFSITQGTQSISFGTQMSPRAFVANFMFGLSPLASASSALPVAYSSLTTGVCTISGTTITMVSAGNCTIAANQSGNANYAAAAQVTQSISFTASAPGKPTLNSAVGGDQKITLSFSPPASNGGSPITGYTANCSGNLAMGTSSPITLSGLTNGMAYSCTVTASNGTSGPASDPLMATPNALPGASLWTSNCNACHGTPPVTFRLNAGGNDSAVLDHVVSNMNGQGGLQGSMVTTVNNLMPADKIAIAQYIREFIPAVSVNTPVNTAVDINVASQVYLNTTYANLTGLQQANAPANGTLTFPGGSTIRYTPNMGFTGTDSFTYRAFNASVQTDIRTVSVTVTPAAPSITSALSATGTIGQAFTYQLAASNGPTSYGAANLPAWASVNMSTGAITGTPNAGGTTMVTLSANGPGGTGMATLSLTVNLASQTITFPAQAPATRAYAQGMTFGVSPTATPGASGNPVVYGSTTPGICTVSGTTVTMVAAGVCTISANQAGNATYAPAPQVTQSVSITGSAPQPPTIGTAIAGNTQATINFTAPVDTGGLPITGYTVNCSGVTSTGTASPITVSGLTNGVAYTCSVQATNLAGTSGSSGTVMVTPVAIAFTGNVFSRKQHGTYTGNLPVDETAMFNAATIEPRSIGAGHQIVFVFNNPVSSANVSVTDAMDVPIVGANASPSFNGSELIVTVTGVADKTRVKVKATGVNGALNVETPIAFLYGDVNQTGRVTAADIAAIKAKGTVMQVGAANFLIDVNVNGGIASSDISAVKAKSGNVLP